MHSRSFDKMRMRWFAAVAAVLAAAVLSLQCVEAAVTENCNLDPDCAENSAVDEARNGLPQLGYLVVAIFDQIANVFGRTSTTTTTTTMTTTTTTKPTTTTVSG